MKCYAWLLMIVIPIVMNASEVEVNSNFIALLSGTNSLAVDNMNALEFLRETYTEKKLKYVKWICFDQNKNAIVARMRSYNRNAFAERFLSITKYLANGRKEEIKSTTTIFNGLTGRGSEGHCDPDPQVVSVLKEEIARFELNLTSVHKRHYYCWEEFSDDE